MIEQEAERSCAACPVSYRKWVAELEFELFPSHLWSSVTLEQYFAGFGPPDSATCTLSKMQIPSSPSSQSDSVCLFLFFNIYLFIYLAALGLSCSM